MRPVKGKRDYTRAVEVCGRLLGIDPLDETTVRRMMRLYASAGCQAAALHEYEASASCCLPGWVKDQTRKPRSCGPVSQRMQARPRRIP